MPTVEQLRSRLLKKLTELFQLDQPDLDFGFYRIMHAKAEEVQEFVSTDLLKIVEKAFGDANEVRKAELKANIEKEIQTARDYGAVDPENSPKVKEAQAAYDAVKEMAGAEAEVYDHLYRFFERYYDAGDFISRRYYTRETSGKAAPFAVPYNGEEVKLHWANADQHYIKSAENFSNYTFDLRQTSEVQSLRKKEDGGLFVAESESPLKVHLRIVEACEGEHGNVKATEASKRFFILHDDNPVVLNDSGELVINFEYRPDPEKTGQENTWRDKRNAEAVQRILERLQMLAVHDGEQAKRASEYLSMLKISAGTDSDKNRILLAKYIYQYTARNTMDYFIHKDLGGFLRRELDFYIKNEVMRLDDIENADAPSVESYLSKIKVLRKIAGKLIDFLAQLEDFQKKLWLKKKFVVETNYCITLDRIPEAFYEEIASKAEIQIRDHDGKMKNQREEWIALFSIDEVVGYSRPLTVEFLNSKNKLVLDTRFFDDRFKNRMLAAIENFDDQCDGLLIHSENFQALNLLQERYREQVKCVYIDPPYNKGNDFAYKDSYQHSSWLSSLSDKTLALRSMLKSTGIQWVSLDENEAENFHRLMKQIGVFKETKLLTAITNLKGIYDADGFVATHEYVICGTVNNLKDVGEIPVSEELLENDWSEDEYGLFKQGDGLRRTGADAPREKRPNGWFPVFVNAQREIYVTETDEPISNEDSAVYPIDSNGNELSWSWSKRKIHEETHNLILKGTRENGFSFYKKQRPGLGGYPTRKSKSFLYKPEYSSTHGGNTAKDLFGLRMSDFTPKSVALLRDLILLGKSEGTSVLDYFAGSGTTGHAIINLNRDDDGKRKFILVEMGDYFYTVLKPRIAKVAYSKSWKDGKPTARESGISHCFKYIRLESYEDTLNNLRFDDNSQRKKSVAANPSLKEDYMLHYLLDVETRGSQSVLNIDAFADPTAYTLKVKKPGTDEYVTRTVDLIETFNYLIGLRLEHSSVPQTFQAVFKRIADPELPEDQHSKLVVDGRIRQEAEGPWWFRKVEGWVPKDPSNPNNGQREKVLIVWRKLTGNIEQDNLMLDEWFQKNRISTRDFEFDTIYVNGSNNLPNLKLDGDNWKVRLIEEEFMKGMWEVEG